MNDHDAFDLEQFAKENPGKGAPTATTYRIRIDKTTKTIDTPTPDGRRILGLVDKTPEQYKLYEHIRGNQPVPIGADQTVNLQAPGVERFTTMARDTTEGLEESKLARAFTLPAHDVEYLDNLELPWEAVKDGQTQWLLIHSWNLPGGYNATTVTVALLIPPQYSDTQIDMVYFSPALARTDGKAIGALSTHSIKGQRFQGWSRHRTPANPWRSAIDDVSSHLTLVDEWLRREFDLR